MKRKKMKLIINISLIVLCVICVGVFIFAYPRLKRAMDALNEIRRPPTTEKTPANKIPDSGTLRCSALIPAMTI